MAMAVIESRNDRLTTDSLDGRQLVAALRAQVLSLKPADMELDAPVARRVWGVVIETAHPDVVSSLIALADGSVSLYVSNGNGCLGCGAHREVRCAAKELLEISARCLDLAVPSDDCAYPPTGAIRFFLLHAAERRVVQIRLEELNARDGHLGVLYFAGQRVIHTIERVGAGQSIRAEIQLAAYASRLVQTPEESICWSAGNAARRLRI